MHLSLADLYNGIKKTIKYSRKIICVACKGTGSKTHSTQFCTGCNGRGSRILRGQTAFGFIQQIQQTCPECQGTGEKIIDKCQICHGKKTVQEEKKLTVDVPQGAKDGQILVYHGEYDQKVIKYATFPFNSKAKRKCRKCIYYHQREGIQWTLASKRPTLDF